MPRLPENPKTPLAKRRNPDSTERMIRPGFLDRESRQDLIELARNGSAAHRLARRANALVLLDDGMSCEGLRRFCCWTTTPSALGIACMKKTGSRA
jgi:hypothetical protein